MKKRLFWMAAAAMCCTRIDAQTFTTEFSAEMQKVEGKMEVAPQLKAILEMPWGKGWSTELELATSQAGLDYRIDAKFDLAEIRRRRSAADSRALPISLLAGASSGDACALHFMDLGLGAAWEKYECTAILHYAPWYSSQDKFLELTAQRNIGPVYIQPGLYLNHAAKEFSITGVLTVGISLEIFQ